MTKHRNGASLVTATMLVVLGCVIGCGSEADTRSVPSMVLATSGDRADPSGPNRAPVVSDVAIQPARPTPGRRVQATAHVSDPDGDSASIVYRWQTSRGRVLGEGKSLDTTGLKPGSRLQLIATANDGRVDSESVLLEFRLSQPSAALSLVAIEPSEGAKPGALLRAVVDVVDGGPGRIEAELEWKVNGEIVGTDETLETASFSPGDVVVLRARLERNNARSRAVSSSALVLSRGGIPEILSKPMAGIEGGLFRYQIRARSAESDAKLTFALLTGPDGMTVDANSGLVQWRPESAQRGRFEIEVSATDQWGSGVAQSFVIAADSPTASPARVR